MTLKQNKQTKKSFQKIFKILMSEFHPVLSQLRQWEQEIEFLRKFRLPWMGARWHWRKGAKRQALLRVTETLFLLSSLKPTKA